MAIIKQVFRRTLTIPTTLPPSSTLSPPPPPICRRLTCIPSAHVNKSILISTPNTSFYPSIPRNTNKYPFQYRIRLNLVVDTEFKSPPRLCYSSQGRGNSEEQMGGNKDDQHGEGDCTKLLTLPTVLTLARVVAIPVFIATFYVNSWWGTTATTSIFVAAAITDWLDGYLARKMRLGTAFGAFLDPVADKLMVAATLVLFCSRPPETSLLGDVPWLFPVPATAIIGREITMSAVREWAASQDTKLLQAVAVNNLGKWKTATQMIALTILVASRDSSLAGSGTLVTSGVALLYISAGLALWSLAVYMRKIWKVLLR